MSVGGRGRRERERGGGENGGTGGGGGIDQQGIPSHTPIFAAPTRNKLD